MTGYSWRVALVVLLLVEAAGALLLALLNLVTSQALGQSVLPWQSAFLPGGFGLLCLLAVAGLAQRRSWGRALAVVASLIVVTGGVLGLMYSGHPALWAAVVMGLAGLWLIRLFGLSAAAESEST
jgi:hypothetical protein